MSENNFKEELENLDFEPDTIDLTLEDGREITCVVLDIFDVKGKTYIALVDEEDDTDEVFFYEYIELNEDEIELNNIEDENLFDEVVDTFEKIYFEEE